MEGGREAGRTVDGNVIEPPLPGATTPASAEPVSPATARPTRATIAICGTSLMPAPHAA